MTGEDLEADAACGEVMHGVDQVAEVAAEAVEFPDGEGIALPEGFETGGESGPVITFSRGGILIEVSGLDAGGDQGILLEVSVT